MMFSFNKRIGYIVDDSEYEEVCNYFSKVYNNEYTKIYKTEDYLLINNPEILIRIFRYIKGNITFQNIFRSGRYLLIVISNLLNLTEAEIEDLRQLVNMPLIQFEDIETKLE